MRIFITGASGHIGSALVPELLAAGHRLSALARSETTAAALLRAGVEIRRGELEDLDTLRGAAREAEGVIHLAYRHDLIQLGDWERAAAVDLATVRALGEALEGSGKALVGVGGTLMGSGLGRVLAEGDSLPSGPRVDTENFLVALAARGIRSSVVRLSPITHSPELDRHGFARVLIALARRSGFSAYIGEGEKRWSAAHTRDSARLLRLALEKAPAGSRLNAAAEEGLRTKDIAAAIGAKLGLPTRSIPPEAAPVHFGFLAGPLLRDAPASSALTRSLLGWKPLEAGLLEDLADEGYYRD